MEELKITETEYQENGVASAEDKLTGSPAQNKAVFDRLPKFIGEKLNALIGKLQEYGVDKILKSYDAKKLSYIRVNDDKRIEVSADGEEWEATAGEGHVIVDKDGNELPPTSRLLFANSEVTNEEGRTVVRYELEKHAASHAMDGTDPLSPAAIGAARNRNYIDNGFFADAVDQRQGYYVPGEASYTKVSPDGLSSSYGYTDTNYRVKEFTNDGRAVFIDNEGHTCYTNIYAHGYVGEGYTIDRWNATTKATRVQTITNGLLIAADGAGNEHAMLTQRITKAKELEGEKVLFSVLTATGELHSVSATLSGISESVTDTPFGQISITTFGENSTVAIKVSPAGMQVVLAAAKLEIGSEQTLAHKAASGKWELNDFDTDKRMELIKCCMSTADESDTYANNNLTPQAINALNRDGDTINGPLRFANRGQMTNFTDGANWNGIGIETFNLTNEGYKRLVLFSNDSDDLADLLLQKYDSNNNLLGEGKFLNTINKPSGTYVGTGDATLRSIDLHAIISAGGVVAIATGSGMMTFVFYEGALTIDTVNGTVAVLSASEVNYRGGMLNTATANIFINGAGYMYYYYVL